MSLGLVRLFLLVLALFGVAAAGFAVADENAQLARLLAERDPGARVGGNTIVASGKADSVWTVPGRPNFVMALGDDETIHGAGKNDQLGALGKHVKIIAPAVGHALIEGGPQSTIVVGGKGHDLVVEHKGGALIEARSRANEIVATGSRDRVVCGPRVHDEMIKLGSRDSVSTGCRGHHDKIENSPASHSATVRKRAPRAFQATECVLGTGQGTNDSPCVRPCLTGTTSECDVTFYPRTLFGLWSSEFVPAYECPLTQRYLRDVNFAPWGTTISPGVEVLGLGPIGVYITGASSYGRELGGVPYAAGIMTWPARDASATNWTTGPASYTIVLHCTKYAYQSYRLPSGS